MAQGVPETRIDVVPRGVDPGFFRPPSDSERVNLRERFGWVDEFVFLHVGAMTDNKGIDRLLQAFSMVVAQYPQARLVLKGVDSIYRSKDRLTGVMRSLTPDAAAAVEARKTYIGGNYKLVDMTRLYQCADAFVAPYVSEAFARPLWKPLRVACHRSVRKADRRKSLRRMSFRFALARAGMHKRAYWCRTSTIWHRIWLLF